MANEKLNDAANPDIGEDWVEDMAKNIQEVENLWGTSVSKIYETAKALMRGHEDAYKDNIAERIKLMAQIAQIEQEYEKNYLKGISDGDKISYEQRRQRSLEERQEELQANIALYKTKLENDKSLSDEEQRELREKIENENTQLRQNYEQQRKSKDQEYAYERKLREADFRNQRDYFARNKLFQGKISGEEAVANRKALKDQLDERLKDIDNDTTMSDNEKVSAKKQAASDYRAQDKELAKDAFWGGMKGSLLDGISNAIHAAIDGLVKELDNNISTIMNLWGQNEARFNSRLEQSVKSENSLRKTMDDFTENYASANAYLKQEDLMKKAIEAVDAGIAYNVEERAFLSTISDSIQSTFNAFDSNLLQIIRLQRADMTASQLGLESALNKFLLNNFQDTSYLTDVYDSIQGTLVDLTSTMNRDDATEVLYEIQKWLGSLYSMGASSGLVTTIAQGLNYLGTGNIEGLFGNQSTNTLFGLAASYSGIDYADLIRDGLNSSNVNSLMRSMVDYLKAISDEQAENVLVQGAFNQVFGTTMSDIRALNNLSVENIATITSSNMSYKDTINELSTQLSAISNRVSTVTKLSNVWDNYMYSSAESIANNPASLLTYKILNIVEDATGGISLPSVFGMGTGISLDSFRLTQLAKGAMFGLSMIGNVGNLLSSLWGSAVGIDMPQYEEFMTGGDFSTGGKTGVSGAQTYVASGSAEDTKQSSLAGATEDVDSAKEISDSAKDDDDHDFNDWYNNVIIEDKFVRAADEISHEKLERIYESMVFLSNEERIQPVLLMGLGSELTDKGVPVKEIGTPTVYIKQSQEKDMKPLSVKAVTDENLVKIQKQLDDFANGLDKITVKTDPMDKLDIEVQW